MYLLADVMVDVFLQYWLLSADVWYVCISACDVASLYRGCVGGNPVVQDG